MEKLNKSYVEKIYWGIIVSEPVIEEVVERDPTKIDNDGKMQGFRFFDREEVIDGEKTYYGERTNVSKWIFFGERLSLDQVKEKYGDNSDYRTLINNMEINSIKHVCHTQAGSFLRMEEGDMTFNEYVSNKFNINWKPPLITKESYARDVKGNR